MKKRGCLHSWSPAFYLLCSPTEKPDLSGGRISNHYTSKAAPPIAPPKPGQHSIFSPRYWAEESCQFTGSAETCTMHSSHFLWNPVLGIVLPSNGMWKSLGRKLRDVSYIYFWNIQVLLCSKGEHWHRREITTAPTGQFLCSQAGQERLQGKANIAKPFCNAQLNKQLQIVWVKAEKLLEWVLNLFSTS